MPAAVGDTCGCKSGIAHFGQLPFNLFCRPLRVARGLLVACHDGGGLATVGVGKGKLQAVGSVFEGDGYGYATFSGVAQELLFEGLVVVAPQGCADSECGGHPVGSYGVALHVVDQKAFQLALGGEVAESVAGREWLTGFDGDAVASHGSHFADALA